MKHQIFSFLLFYLFVIANAEASGPQVVDSSGLLKDSLLRKYLVFERIKNKRTAHFFKEGQVLTIVDSTGRAVKGHLKILDGERVVLTSKAEKTDTFPLSKIRMVKRSSLTGKIVGVVVVLVGATDIVIGALLLSDARYGDPYGIETAFGLICLQGGILYSALGALSFNGTQYACKEYSYRVIQTRGFELKKKYIGRL